MRTALVAGLVVATSLGGTLACGNDGSDSTRVESVGQRVDCEPVEEGVFPLFAALAITMGFELQRWEATTDLAFRANRYDMTQIALDRCTENGVPRCDNVQAILDFQDADPIIMNGEVVFNPELYRQYFREFFRRQWVMDHLPCAHPNASWCAEHELTFHHDEPGPCTSDYFFAIDASVPDRCSSDSKKWGCAGGWRSHQCHKAAAPAWRLFDRKGKCVGGGKAQSRCRNIDLDPTRIITKLAFAGYPDNGFLGPDFQYVDDLTLVGIDPPLFAMVEGETIPMVDGCVAAVAVYDPNGTLAGTCCDVNGTRGTLAVSSWNASTLVCE